MSTTANLTSADELFRIPDDGYRYELVEGEVSKMSPSGFEHGAIIGRLHWRLADFIYKHRLGEVMGAETGFLLGREPDTVLAPDVAFVRKEQLAETGIPKTFYPVAPALVVEVVSPSDTVEGVDAKMRRWLDAGVELAWVVNPGGRTVTVYRSTADIRVLTENDSLDGAEVLPAFQCRVGDIFVNA